MINSQIEFEKNIKEIENNLAILENNYTKKNNIMTFYKDNYEYNNFETNEKHNLIEKIKNCNLTTDYNELLNIFETIVPVKRFFKEIKTFEFLFIEPTEKVNTPEKLLDIAKITLKKYQYLVGGYNIEDIEWNIITESNIFNIKNGEFLLVNTIDENKAYSKELLWFMEKITILLKKYVDNNKIKIKYQIIDDENNKICWLVFIVKTNSNNDDDDDNDNEFIE
jgi:hypothetical protein